MEAREQLARRIETATPAEAERLCAIADNLDRGWSYGRGMEPRASSQGWEEALYWIMADGAAISATTTETKMVPDFSIPANYLYQGRTLKYTLLFDWSTVITTPGTLQFWLRWGGAAGTSLATSGAFAPDPTAASTTVSGMVEWWLTCRAVGTTGSAFVMGRLTLNDFDDTSAATVVGNLNMQMAPTSAPAAVTIDTTTASNALTPTAKFSVATAGTQLTTHLAILESLN